MKKRCLIIIILFNLSFFPAFAQNENQLLKNFPNEYLTYSQEDYYILDFFSLDNNYKVVFMGGKNGTFSVLLNNENLICDTFKVTQEYLKVSALLSLNEGKHLATTDMGLLSFEIANSKISNLEFVTADKKNQYNLASMNEKLIYMKPQDVIRNKLKWRISSKESDEIIYESDSKFKDFKNINLPTVWNRMYYIDSVFVFNDPLNHKILTYNPLSDHFKTINYSILENELYFLYYDSVLKKSYLVGFNNEGKSYRVYEFNLLEPDQYNLIKTIEHLYPPKSIHDNAVFVEDAFMESDKNCIVRVPLE